MDFLLELLYFIYVSLAVEFDEVGWNLIVLGLLGTG